jgi:hypothetical protein
LESNAKSYRRQAKERTDELDEILRETEKLR